MFPLYVYLAPIIGAILFLSIEGSPAHPFFFYLGTPPLQPHFTYRPIFHFTSEPVTFSTSPQQVSIADLLENSQDYHQHVVSVRGLITQPELHLDDTELYLDFVFRLSQGKHSIVVYGRHDRTQGAPPIIMNHSVEVLGTFWKEQDRKGLSISNALEAIVVTPYPSPIPEST